MHRRATPTAVLAVFAVLAAVAALFTLAAPAQAADRDCSDFDTQAQAQQFYVNNGGPQQDPHRLDADDDGRACDSLPCPCSSATGGGGTSTGGTTTLRQRAKVLAVVDGDTIDVRLANGNRKRVRLVGIDTPEVYGGTECGGPQASRSLKGLLPRGQRVLLVSDSTQDRTDRYGRLLRYVMKPDGRDVNRSQVSRGWARVYVYNGDPFKRVTNYRRAQTAAKGAPRGIWKVC